MNGNARRGGERRRDKRKGEWVGDRERRGEERGRRGRERRGKSSLTLFPPSLSFGPGVSRHHMGP